MQKIITYLWFDSNAEEAVNYYVSIFNNSKINAIARYPEGSRMPAGLALTIDFQLEGQRFLALNGGPQFKFTEAISLLVDCSTQEEVDTLWNKLSEGGETQMCGWLKDKYGLSWQIIPNQLGKLLSGPDKEKAGRVMQVMLKMTKIEIEKLLSA